MFNSVEIICKKSADGSLVRRLIYLSSEIEKRISIGTNSTARFLPVPADQVYLHSIKSGMFSFLLFLLLQNEEEDRNKRAAAKGEHFDCCPGREIEFICQLNAPPVARHHRHDRYYTANFRVPPVATPKDFLLFLCDGRFPSVCPISSGPSFLIKCDQKGYTHTHAYIHIYTPVYIYIYI